MILYCYISIIIIIFIYSFFSSHKKAFLDGSSRIKLIDSNIGLVNGLAVDDGIENHDRTPRIYWSDEVLKRIETAIVDGTQRRIIIASGLTLPFSITVLGDYIYWSDLYHKVVERANRWTGFNYDLISDNIENIKQIRAVAESKQKIDFYWEENPDNPNIPHSNPCAQQNGQCSHLCLFRSHGYICACPLIIDTPCSTGNYLISIKFQTIF